MVVNLKYGFTAELDTCIINKTKRMCLQNLKVKIILLHMQAERIML